MVKDRNNNSLGCERWRLPGKPIPVGNPSLVLINSTTLQVKRRFVFPHLNDLAGPIATNPAGDSLYFVHAHIYKMSIDDTALPESYCFRNGKTFGAWPPTLSPESLYVSDAIGFYERGKSLPILPNGAPVDTFEVGIIPGSFCFNPES